MRSSVFRPAAASTPTTAGVAGGAPVASSPVGAEPSVGVAASALAPAAVGLAGTRAAVNGVTLISSGCGGLDAAIGGGIPLGTLMVIGEDGRGGPHATTLALLYMAQGLAAGQTVLVVGGDGRGSLDGLAAALPKKVLPAVVPAVGDASPSDSGLRIAWQYGKYLTPTGTGHSMSAMPVSGTATGRSTPRAAVASAAAQGFRDEFDLSQTEADASDKLKLLNVACSAQPYDDAFAFISAQVAAAPATVVRVVVLSPGGSAWPQVEPPHTIAARLRFMKQLQQLVHSQPNVHALLTLPRGLPHRLVTFALHLCDLAFTMRVFGDPDEDGGDVPEFSDFTGLMRLQKVPRLNALTGYTPDTLAFVFKRERRHVSVHKLHLPPEMSRSSSSSTTSTGPAAHTHTPGMACATSLRNPNANPLDF